MMPNQRARYFWFTTPQDSHEASVDPQRTHGPEFSLHPKECRLYCRIENKETNRLGHSMKRTATLPRFSLALLAIAVLASVTGCREKSPSAQSNPEPLQTLDPAPMSQTQAQTQTPKAVPAAVRSVPEPPPPVAQIEAPVATPEAALEKLSRNSGLEFAGNTKVVGYGDGGVPDPGVGFYEWMVVSPLPLALPGGRQIGDADVLNLPVETAVQLFGSKMEGTKIENPVAAFSIGWQNNGYSFNGTWIRGKNADYVVVQQTR